ncbi:decorin-like protein [Labeo rohita]|uniref:Decorin n=2 Tax=Labeo rohita TaxID=84645 RepID=A0A498M9M2_LABRO|nr:decorin-like protein [Labeo rohita]
MKLLVVFDTASTQRSALGLPRCTSAPALSGFADLRLQLYKLLYVQASISNMKSACLSLLLVSVCWALPFRQSGFMDFMMEDEAGSGSPIPSTRRPPVHLPPLVPDVMPDEGPDGPFCPFRCQCHLRVSQCSDLGLKNVPEKIPLDTTLLDLQNNKISEIRENDFKGLKSLQTLILVNNKITIIHAKAFSSLMNLERLYLSKNLLKDVPANIPKSLQELRIHENQINKIKKSSFAGMANVIVMELGSNPLSSSGVDSGAFADLKRVSYIRIADTNITSIPKGLPSSLFELHLDGNKITKVTADSLKGLKNLSKLGLSHNEISVVENGSLANVPHLRELHLDNNILTVVPSGLPEHKYIQVIYLHANKIAAVGTEDFCPPGYNTKKAMYSGISLFSNPVPYWEVQPITFRCVFDRSAIQLGNYRKK